MLIAITRKVSESLVECELTFMERQIIEVPRAIAQHQAYERWLSVHGATVVSLPLQRDMPDAVFIEDVAIVLDRIAILTPMGSFARKLELAGVKEALSPFREVTAMSNVGNLEGGDIVKVGRTLYVGLSTRTDMKGISELEAILATYDYEVIPVPVNGCLHLKTACSYLGNNTLLVNHTWVETTSFKHFNLIPVAEGEPWAANVITLEDWILASASSPRTSEALTRAGFKVETIDISELAKAEAGLTCMSLIFRA